MKNKYLWLSIILVFVLFANIPIFTHANEDGILTKNQITTTELSTFNYLLYTPQQTSANMPLIVYLHGGSGRGDNLDLITGVAGFPQYINDGVIEDVPAYIIFPQVPSGRSWSNMAVKTSVKELIEHICATYSIDRTRISLTGHSMGGTGTWSIALSYPEMFSAIAPMSGSIDNTAENINQLANTPVWAVVGSADTIVSPTSSTEFVASLKEKNSYARITTIPGASHIDVPNVYLDKNLDIINWLINNVRENSIIGFSSNKVSIKFEVPGEYSLILADYEGRKLNNLKIISRPFAFGKTQITVPSGITLGLNDKIMLWQNINSFTPSCETYTIVSE